MSNKELDPRFFGTAAINPMVVHTSSPRGVMDSSHFAAHLALLYPDEKLIKGGIEYELGKTINDVKAEENCVVKAVIPRYGEYGVEHPPVNTVFVEFERTNDKGEVELFIDYIQVPIYNSTHSVFGYNLTPTEAFSNLSYNSELKAGEVLAKAASYGKDGAYNYGLSCNVAFMSHPSVAEDGFVISESLAKRAGFATFSKKIINIDKNTIPVNVNGDKDNFKFLPDIGEQVRPDGLLCALRERNDWFSVSDMSTANLGEVDITFDNPIYVSPHSVVIDIQVMRGNTTRPEFCSKMTEQLDRYAAMLMNYYSKVVTQYENIMAEKKALFGSTDNIRLTPRLTRFMADTMIKLGVAPASKGRLCYRKLPIDQYRIEITTMSLMNQNLGFKLTDVHASKGVSCLILPDAQMPVDKNGVRADVITDSPSTIARMNLGRAYEAYLGAFSRDNRTRLTALMTANYGPNFLENHSAASLAFARGYLRDMYSMVNPEMVEFIDALTAEQFASHLKDVIEENLYLYCPTDNDYNVVDIISAIEKSTYKPLNDKVTYMDAFGRTVETADNVRIGVLYFMFLEKVASTFSAVASSKINNFGLPVKGANVDKPRYPHSLTPVKFNDEATTRNLLSFMGPEAVADMLDLALNPNSHKLLYRSILESDKAFDPNFDIDRGIIPYGETKSLQIMRHVFTAMGVDMVHEPEN